MIRHHWSLFLIALLLVLPVQGWAQQPDADPNANISSEFGFHLGNLLPAQIDGVTEIMPLWGLRGGYRLAQGFVEFGGIGGNARGAEWTNLHLSLRADMPIEGLVGILFFGADATQFKGAGKEKKIFGGGHVGGGVYVNISPTVWFRGEMKFNVNPGTSLYIGFGFVFRFQGGGTGAPGT
ncbi:MAG: hypothetical protein KDD43_11115 [Bdellovibrionales bacterium]|nr:hypothetical protein [Bdellovibrionales bacterium]